ncbi:MAG: hypothetical protein ABW148_17730 [Sedimenticola sp.]
MVIEWNQYESLIYQGSDARERLQTCYATLADTYWKSSKNPAPPADSTFDPHTAKDVHHRIYDQFLIPAASAIQQASRGMADYTPHLSGLGLTSGLDQTAMKERLYWLLDIFTGKKEYVHNAVVRHHFFSFLIIDLRHLVMGQSSGFWRDSEYALRRWCESISTDYSATSDFRFHSVASDIRVIPQMIYELCQLALLDRQEQRLNTSHWKMLHSTYAPQQSGKQRLLSSHHKQLSVGSYNPYPAFDSHLVDTTQDNGPLTIFFGHEETQEYLYDRLSAMKQRRSHQRASRSIESIFPSIGQGPGSYLGLLRSLFFKPHVPQINDLTLLPERFRQIRQLATAAPEISKPLDRVESEVPWGNSILD